MGDFYEELCAAEPDSELDLSDPVALVSLVRWAFLGEAQHDLGFSCRGFMACPSACSTE